MTHDNIELLTAGQNEEISIHHVAPFAHENVAT